MSGLTVDLYCVRYQHTVPFLIFFDICSLKKFKFTGCLGERLSWNWPKFTKKCPFLVIPHACHDFPKYALQLEKYASISPYDTDDEEITVDITYIRKIKYVHDYVYDAVQPITCAFVPGDINGTTVYIAPLRASRKVNNCKGTRPWEYGQTNKSKSFTKGQRLLFNCRGNYCCANVKCSNITDFGVKRLEFQQKAGVMTCSLCGEIAAYLPCGGRLILEKNTKKKHYGTHPFPIEVKGRSKRAFKIAKEFPRLTRESMIRQRAQQQLEQSTFSVAVATTKNYTDKTYIDNINRKEKKKRRPDGYCIKAVKILKTTFEKEVSYLVYSFNDGSDRRLHLFQKVASSKIKSKNCLKVKLLQNLEKDSNYRLSNETVYLDVLHSRYVMIT